jgi:carbon storage regulator
MQLPPATVFDTASRVSPYKHQGFVLINQKPAFGKIPELSKGLPENPLLAKRSGMETENSQGGSTMLVLSRKRGEMITIGEGVTVTVLAIQGDRVKIGVMAPAEVPVHRQEIHERIGDCSSVLDFAACS